MSHARFKQARPFVVGFVLVYGLLVLSWPCIDWAYRAFIQGLARGVFASENGPRELGFHSVKTERGLSLTRVEIVNRRLMQWDGSGPVRHLEIDTGGFWRATSLFVALVVVSPVAWRRRVRALLWGGLWLHAFILFAVGFAIWNESRHVLLVTMGPFWGSCADRFQQMLIAQFSIAAPCLIWILLTFRRQELEGLVFRGDQSRPSGSRQAVRNSDEA